MVSANDFGISDRAETKRMPSGGRSIRSIDCGRYPGFETDALSCKGFIIRGKLSCCACSNVA